MSTAVETTLYLFFFSLFTVSAVGETEKETLYFLSLLPYPNDVKALQPAYTDGPSLAPAAHLAVDQINNRTDILADYHIELIEENDGCQHSSVTIISFLDKVLYSDLNVVGIIGPTCSPSVYQLASLTRRERISLLNLHIESYFVPDHSEFPYTFGTSPADVTDASDQLYVKLLERNNWKEFGIFSEGSVADNFITLINGTKKITFFVDVTENTLPVEEAEKSLTRVILAFTNPHISRPLACLAYHRNITYPTYQWVFILNYSVPYFEFVHQNEHYSCTEKEMNLENSIVFTSKQQVNSDDQQSPTVSGQTYNEYLQSYNERLKQYNNETGYNDSFVVWANPIYDGTWALALVLNKSIPELQQKNLSLSEYRFGHDEVTRVIAQKMIDVEFQGVSGYVSFKNNQSYIDRGLFYDIYQLVNGTPRHVGSMNGTHHLLGLDNATFIDDSFEIIEVFAHITVVFIFSVFAAVALLLTIGAHVINTVCREQRSVKASSPHINHFAYAGCYLLIAAMVVESVKKSAALEDLARKVLCNALLWLYNIGLTLIVATVCAKTWRLYVIFSLSLKISMRNSKKRQILKARFVGTIVFLLSSVTVLVCVVLGVVDPITTKEDKIILYDDQKIPINVEVQKYCDLHSDVYWVGALTLYEFLIMAFSIVFALSAQTNHGMEEFKTRNVAVLAYLLALTMGLCLPIYWITHQFLFDITIQYTIQSIWLMIMVYLCIAFLFLPPILPVLKSYGTDNPVPKRMTERSTLSSQLLSTLTTP